jgi:hypothetical protein
MAMVGALSLLTSGTPRKSTALLVAIGAFLALRRMVFGRN